MSSSSPHDLNALATLATICGDADTSKYCSNGDVGDNTKGSGEGAASFGNNPPASIGPSLNGLLAIYQHQGQHQFIQQQAAVLQQAATERVRQVLSSMPPHLLHACLSSQRGVAQALQSTLGVAGGGGGHLAAAAQPGAAALAAAFPALAASAEQQQHAAQLQMVAAQVLAAAVAATENGQIQPNQQSQPNAKSSMNVSEEISMPSSPSAKRARTSAEHLPPKKRSPLSKIITTSSRAASTSAAAAVTSSSQPSSTTSIGAAVRSAAAEVTSSSHPSSDTTSAEGVDKKLAKAAANRLSAQLSRKRKKMFLSNLKAENTELKRMDMILRSIPDHIVAFDSSGCITFASQSFNRVMEFTSDEVESTSFWDLLTEDSVRLMKSAFMDALAIKRNDEDTTTPLADGVPISVRIIEEKGGLLFSLKGVVHFASDYPECVCTLCPEHQNNDTSFLNDTTRHISDGS